MNCPHCFTGLRRFTPWQPGQMTVCGACGVIIRVNESYAALPATPEELTAQPHFIYLMEASCRALRKRILSLSGAVSRPNGTTTPSAVERRARSGAINNQQERTV
jgi:hypothetical protein